MKKKNKCGSYRPTLFDMLSQSSKEALFQVKKSIEENVKKEQTNLAWLQLNSPKQAIGRMHR